MSGQNWPKGEKWKRSILFFFCLGSFDSSIFDFKQNHITNCQLWFDNKAHPSNPYKLSTDENDLTGRLDGFASLFNADQQFEDTGIYINLERYSKSFFMLKYHLDNKPSRCAGDGFPPKKIGSVRLSLDFSIEIPEPLRIHVISKSLCTLQITKNREVIRDFSL